MPRYLFKERFLGGDNHTVLAETNANAARKGSSTRTNSSLGAPTTCSLSIVVPPFPETTDPACPPFGTKDSVELPNFPDDCALLFGTGYFCWLCARADDLPIFTVIDPSVAEHWTLATWELHKCASKNVKGVSPRHIGRKVRVATFKVPLNPTAPIEQEAISYVPSPASEVLFIPKLMSSVSGQLSGLKIATFVQFKT